jgi:c-di-GMP-binding flagellar brake protein YcgR
MASTAENPEPADGLSRRDGYRVRLDQPVRFYVLDAAGKTSWVRCNLRDVSVTGAAIEVVGLELEVGSALLLRIDVGRNDEDTFQVRAKVVRAAPSAARVLYGVRFVGITKYQLEDLHHAVSVWTRRRTRQRVW